MKSLSRLLLLILLLGSVATVTAQDKPRWANKGVSSLNKKRSNDTYEFVKFETFGGSIDRLRQESGDNLAEYFAKRYNLKEEDATVTLVTDGQIYQSTPNDEEGDERIQRIYLISFAGEMPFKFYAELVDEYVTFDENVDMTYDYTLYQLYAVSANATGTIPAYDDFSYSRKYNASAVVMSIIPGMGQFYKGQTTKGLCFLGGDIVFAATTLYCEHKRREHIQNSKDHPDVGASYRSKAKSWRTMRNLAVGCAAVTYVWNLFDAAVSKGARQVIVEKPSRTKLALGPSLVYDPMSEIAPAMSLTVTF